MGKIFGLDGSVKGEIELPGVFSSSIRPDLVQRSVLVSQAARRQPYGADKLAGKRTAAKYLGVKDTRGSMKNREIARGPRVTGSNPGQDWRMRFVPQARGGRKAHPPKVEKKFVLKLNKKEKRLALVSAIAATASREIVAARGHKLPDLELPLIVDSGIERVKKAKELRNILARFGLEQELERAAKRKFRAGRGKMRGRKYKSKVGPLVVIVEDGGIIRAARNIPGVSVSTVNALNAEVLAPGAKLGRLTLWSENAIKQIGEKFG